MTTPLEIDSYITVVGGVFIAAVTCTEPFIASKALHAGSSCLALDWTIVQVPDWLMEHGALQSHWAQAAVYVTELWTLELRSVIFVVVHESNNNDSDVQGVDINSVFS